MLAQMIAGHAGSSVLALDRTAAKAARVRQLADSWGVGDVVQVMAADSTQLYQQQQQQQGQEVCLQQPPDCHEDDDPQQPATSSSRATNSKKCSRQRMTDQQQQQQADLLAAAQPGSFDAVLLDAPCSALGLRPRLLMGWQLPQLEALAAYQRALLHAAVHVLKPGGSLVYCTCTINPGARVFWHSCVCRRRRPATVLTFHAAVCAAQVRTKPTCAMCWTSGRQ
jgi:16S rRNA C967 or C1407 C5-methylase (RsmB/RsmF family)